MPKQEENFKFIKPGEIRTRFSPSPTGFLHIGNARTALFNFIFTRKHQGRVILRIEDTDKKRSTPGNEKVIFDSLKWLNIEWDEGPDGDGNYGPYRQSERSKIYKKYLEKLLKEGRAYHCFCSIEDLEAHKQYAMSIGKPPVYSGKCAELPKETVDKHLKEGRESIVRFKTPAKNIAFKDLVKGEVETDTSLLGDFSIAKDLESPLYNFACAIDDFEMKITHVIRGDDHLSNTPKQMLIQEALGFPRPQYAHLPMILASDKSKLSKRHGAVGVLEYKKMGYLSEAMINFLAFLGWNPGTEREIFSLASLIKEFSLERVKKSGAVFNLKRLDYLNGFYIRQRPIKKLTPDCLSYLIESKLIEKTNEEEKPLKTPEFKVRETGEIIDLPRIEKIISIYHQRLKKISEISELTDFFFKKELKYEKELLRWKDQKDQAVVETLDKLKEILSKIEDRDWDKENLEKILLKESQAIAKQDRGYLLWPLRLALTGKKASATPFEIGEILGKEKTLERIEQAKQLING